MNLGILKLKTCLIISKIIQLVKYLLKKFKYIKRAGIIKYKKCTPGRKELLNLFNDLLDTILTNKTLKSESQEDENENENETENQN